MRSTKKAKTNGNGLSRESVFQHLMENYDLGYRLEPILEDEFTPIEFRQAKHLPETTATRILTRCVEGGLLECRWAYSPTLRRKVRAYRFVSPKQGRPSQERQNKRQ